MQVVNSSKAHPETETLPAVKGTYRFNADLSKSNWFQVGGPAQILFRPADKEDLINFLKNKPANLKITVLGVGSNIIIRDGGIKGVTIKLGGSFAKISHRDGILRTGGSALCSNVALYAKLNGLGGLEFLSSIPGSMGGAIAMNAGCYGSDISGFLIKAEAISFLGKESVFVNQDFGFKYRGHSLANDLIFTEAEFKTYPDNPEAIAHKIANFSKRREETQPIRSKTGGSTFKNPAGYKAWELIDQAGCRGLKLGDAQISEKHCNFMINTGKASAHELITLGNLVRKKVQEKTGIELKWEIKLIGED